MQLVNDRRLHVIEIPDVMLAALHMLLDGSKSVYTGHFE